MFTSALLLNIQIYFLICFIQNLSDGQQMRETVNVLPQAKNSSQYYINIIN
jgi:hypothetical protein